MVKNREIIMSEAEKSPEMEAVIIEQVLNCVQVLIEEMRAKAEDNAGNPAAMIERLQQSLELLSPSDTLQRDSRQNYAMSIAFGEMAIEDQNYLEYFDDALDGLTLDQNLTTALSGSEKAVYDQKIREIESRLQ